VSAAPTVGSLGEGGVLLQWPADVHVDQRAAAIATAWRAVQARNLRGVVDVVPAPAGLLVRFDPLAVTRAEVEAVVGEAAVTSVGAMPRSVTEHTVGVRYGGDDGPDLEQVAERLGLATEHLVAMHLEPTYTVSSTGFMPGFVYMGPLAPRLKLARRGEPRARVPAGSVAIAERQTGIYGVDGPGGWWLIGRTAKPTFDPAAFPPTPFAIGDRVRFTRGR
jgi:KipI family sensor histidine kinase inhibitor